MSKQNNIDMAKQIKRYNTRLDSLMDQHGIKNDTELAEKLGLSGAALSTRLKGGISTDTLGRLADHFNLTIKDLLI